MTAASRVADMGRVAAAALLEVAGTGRVREGGGVVEVAPWAASKARVQWVEGQLVAAAARGSLEGEVAAGVLPGEAAAHEAAMAVGCLGASLEARVRRAAEGAGGWSAALSEAGLGKAVRAAEMAAGTPSRPRER